MKQALIIFVAVAAAALGSGPALGWDRTGHLVVAHISWEQLSPEARAEAASQLAAAPEDAGLRQLLPDDSRALAERQGEHFQNAANWPDIVRDGDFPQRRRAYDHGNWHYINYFFEQRGPERTPVDREDLQPQDTNVAERLEHLVPTLGNRSLPRSLRGVHLAWVLHLTGDIHQPLHCTARVTETEPRGDRGGNHFDLDDGLNLHGFWDGIIRRSHLRWFLQGDASYIEKVAAAITTKHPLASFGDRVQTIDFDAWGREGFALAKSDLYPPDLLRGKRPSTSYAMSALELAEERIALAGYRLAHLLEQQLGDPPTGNRAKP